jgi:phosphatidylglycerol:prolipoprotein diacylglycerol transferase
MHPELFRIPFTELTVKSYGVLMTAGFVAAIYIIRRLSRGMGENAEHITTAALYSLIAGVVGARVFYVIHYFGQFRGRGVLAIFAVWEGGLELFGGVLLAILVIVVYLRTQKLPVRRYLDILAVGLMLALVFGRLGCFFNGCCFGRPANFPLSVRFPYGSLPYQSQVRPDGARNRKEAYIDLPADFFGFTNDAGEWTAVSEENKYDFGLKPPDLLTPQERLEVTEGPFRCLPVWPTQFFESASALAACILLYLHRKKGIALYPHTFTRTPIHWEDKAVDECGSLSQAGKRQGHTSKGVGVYRQGRLMPVFFRSGVTFALMFIIYGAMRFFIEFLRDDNPIQADGLTISQNISIAFVITGLLLIGLFAKMRQRP